LQRPLIANPWNTDHAAGDQPAVLGGETMATLPILPVVQAAFSRVTSNPQQTLKIALPFFVAIVVLNVLSILLVPADPNTMSGGAGLILFVFLIIYIVINTSIAIAWHRVTLIGYAADGGKLKIEFGSRFWRFFGYSLLVIPLSIVVGIFVGIGAVIAPAVAAVLGIVSGLAAIYVLLRWSMTLPATAVDHPTSLKISWQQTAGNFWPLFAIMLIIGVVCGVPLYLLGELLGLILGGMGVVGQIIIQLIMIPLQILTTFIAISALSYAYRYLTAHPDPLTVTA
jgi:hypothetical protein